ncbi:MAG TPA: preprotein translocase subunit SecA [Tepidisphaeraceae bacterium]|jgi:preprotein translocase subunit SecA|nr:preprotein translocase subunit SecA [Tepidisphaeraceae bacterium]
MPITFSKVLTKVFGSRNDRMLKRYWRIAKQVNEAEAKVLPLTDAQLRARTLEIRTGLVAGTTKMPDVLHEAMSLMRESMDRNIGIREIFNPDQNFDPDQFDDATLEAYDRVQQSMIQSGESWRTVAIPPEIYSGVRKIYPDSRPPFRCRPFDVQVIGGLVLYEGKIAEMATGEGKTFVGPLACFLRAIEGQHCHVVTVNDYLVRRDSQWVKPAFEALGITVGYIQQDMEPGGESRKRMYQCDITYGINSEFGFDYLRDNMKERAELQVQGPLDFAIVDEVDSILIDEARTPLIISGPAHDDAEKYRRADAVARKVLELNRAWDSIEREAHECQVRIKAAQGDQDKARDKAEKEEFRKREAEWKQKLVDTEKKKEGLTQYYEVELDRKSVHLTHEGIQAAQDIAGVGSFYVGNNMEWPHLMEQALRAHVVYERDKDYVVEPGQRTGELEVVIVDEFTGRKMVGRQWSEGLHQAAEAKERVPIKQETQTLATITLQNFFKLYKGISGMTGTAMTEAEEFNKIYRLDVVTIPTNRPRIRADREDRVYRSEREKWQAIADEVKEFSEAGRPVLVGTTSIEKSEMISRMLSHKFGIEHNVLNAKQHERESHIVADAGTTRINSHGERVGTVTIATNMAGRGTDIKLVPEAWFDVESTGDDKFILTQRGTGAKIEVAGEDHPLRQVFQLDSGHKIVGGLHVIGTERHTARRIDNQLRGRSGRQGDPGSSRFYVSLEDELMKMFAGEWTVKVLGWLGMEEGMAIEDKRITKGIVRAQKKVEERNYLARKNLLEYDEVMDYQRIIFYGMRQQVLEGREIDKVIWQMIGQSIEDAVEKYITSDYVAAIVCEWTRGEFDIVIEPTDLKGLRRFEDLEDYIKGQARAEAETNIGATLVEFMGEDPQSSSDWDVRGLSAWAESKFRLQFSPAQLKSMAVHDVERTLKEAALELIAVRDVSPISKFVEPLFAERELSAWAMDKFAVDIDPSEFISDATRSLRKPAPEIVATISKRAREAYAKREIEYSIDHILNFAFGGPNGTTENPYASDFFRAWVGFKYGVDLPLEHIRASTVPQLRQELVNFQEQFLKGGKIDQLADEIIRVGAGNPQNIAQIATRRFTVDANPVRYSIPVTPKEVEAVIKDPAALKSLLVRRGTDFFRRELTDLEQFIMIQIFDQSWKDHLYAMDMLRTSIGLQAFAEQDPRVLYKVEGYRYFKEMMSLVRDKVTDLIFKARLGGQPEAPRNAYKPTAAVHQENDSYGVAENLQELAPPESEQQSSAGGETPPVTKTIERTTPKVGRNDPCPCGSGKKYKKCHGINEE